MSNRRRGFALGLAVSATLVAGALSTAPAMAATHAPSDMHPNLGRYMVCADTLSVWHSPGGTTFDTPLRFGETFDMESKDSSGNWAYGAAYGHVNAHGWVIAAYLC